MHLERISDDFGRVSAAGDVLPHAGGKIVTGALAMAKGERLQTVLVDFSGLRLAWSLSTQENYDLGKRIAEAGAGLLRVAFVTSQQCIERHGFALVVARNRGLSAAAFTSESDALRWLKAA